MKQKNKEVTEKQTKEADFSLSGDTPAVSYMYLHRVWPQTAVNL